MRADFLPQVAMGYHLNRQVVDERSWIKFLIDIVLAAFGLPNPAPVAPPLPQNAPVSVVTPEPAPKYDWSNIGAIKASIRKICKEEGLGLEQTDTLVATIGGESQYVLNAKCLNKNSKGVVVSTDWGLCQWNDYWHGKEISPEEAVNNPEKAVRLMCAYWKRDQRNLWIAWKNGSYKKYL